MHERVIKRSRQGEYNLRVRGPVPIGGDNETIVIEKVDIDGTWRKLAWLDYGEAAQVAAGILAVLADEI